MPTARRTAGQKEIVSAYLRNDHEEASLDTHGALGTLALAQAASADGVAGEWKVEGTANGMPIKITCTLNKAKDGALSNCTSRRTCSELPMRGAPRLEGSRLFIPDQLSGTGPQDRLRRHAQVEADIEEGITSSNGPARRFTAKK
ncbi:MAG: hypothetical protein U1F35_08010 [Steroidobacteraceae bacterium]